MRSSAARLAAGAAYLGIWFSALGIVAVHGHHVFVPAAAMSQVAAAHVAPAKVEPEATRGAIAMMQYLRPKVGGMSVRWCVSQAACERDVSNRR